MRVKMLLLLFYANVYNKVIVAKQQRNYAVIYKLGLI